MNFGIPDDFTTNLNKGMDSLKIKQDPPQEPTDPPQDPPTDPPASIDPPADPPADPPQDPPADPPQDPPTTPEITDEQFLTYINRDRETPFESMEDVFKTKEVEKIVEKEVNPWEDVMDETDKAYLEYKKETKRTRKEFDFLNQDFSKISALDMAIKRIKKENGLPISTEQAKNYLEQKLDIDLSGDEVSMNDTIELNLYGKPLRDSLEAEKEKYRTPLENTLKDKKPEPQVETVELEDGRVVSKTDYEEFQNNRAKYIEDVKKAVDSVAAFDFSIEFDDNGEKRKIDFSYEPSQEDRHSMILDASDVDAMINKRYQTKDSFNHKELSEALWWGVKANQQKVIAAAMEKARAETIEEFLADNNNENFNRQKLQKTKTKDDGYGELTGKSDNQGFGVKYTFGEPK